MYNIKIAPSEKESQVYELISSLSILYVRIIQYLIYLMYNVEGKVPGSVVSGGRQGAESIKWS